MHTEPIIDDLDLIPTDVKYPNFVIDGNNVTLNERTYMFDDSGSVISIATNKGSYSVFKNIDYDHNPYRSESYERFDLPSFPSAKDFIDALLNHLPSLGDVVDAILGPLESILADLIAGVKNFFSELLASIISKFNSMIEYYNELKQMIQDAINRIINYVVVLYTDAKNKIISAYRFTVDGVKYILNALKTYAKMMWQYVIKKVDQGIAAAKEFANKTSKYFKYTMYILIIFIIVGVILVSIFRFAPIDLRVKLV